MRRQRNNFVRNTLLKMKNPLQRALISTSVVLLMCLQGADAAAPDPSKPGEKLKFVLMLMRHGVRSPTWANARLDEYSKEPWPKWDVEPGLLTPHGKTLITQLGAYNRQVFAQAGLLPENGCADAQHVFIYADTDERTLETGRGLADGMMPGCKVLVHSAGEGVQDALFHSAGLVGKADSALAFAAVAGRIGNDPSALTLAYESELRLMDQVLAGCFGKPCANTAKKQLLQIAAALSPGTGDHLVDLKGPLSTGATFAENMQLEFLEGMPAAAVGWGQVDEAAMRSLMTLHAASSDILQRTPYIAQVQASNLLSHMLLTLRQAAQQKPVAGAIGVPGDKLVVLAGHDTNISNIAALLDAHWLINGYQRDDAVPGGALVFELWQVPGQDDEVRVFYEAQMPLQMRNAIPVTLAQPPGKARVFLPGCSVSGDSAACPLQTVERLMENGMNP
jgi:4-phytase/acid phosphatase